MTKSNDMMMPLLLVGGVVVAVVAYIKRCDWFKMCGNEEEDVPAVVAVPADDEEEIPTAEPAPPTLPIIEGRLSEAKSECCKCKRKQNGDVRCQRHGKGSWMRYRSAKKDMIGALNICKNWCGPQQQPVRMTAPPVQLNSYMAYYDRMSI